MNYDFYRFEKMISGAFLGELVRLAIVDIVEQGLLFSGIGSTELSRSGSFYTKYVSDIER